MSDSQLTVQLCDGCTIPQLGLGVWQASDAEAASAVKIALEEGYRHIDTAAIYGNEEGVGRGIRASGVSRDQVFLTTKVWNDAHGFDAAKQALDASLARLNVEYVDLLLIHWPVPSRDKFVETWSALIDLQRAGKAKSIGVSNFNKDHLQKLITKSGVVPVLNQIELHPFMQQKEICSVHHELQVATQAWSPLGQGSALTNPVVLDIARKHGRTAAQIIIRWHLELGNIVIPKSITPARIKENLHVFDFSLNASDMSALATLDNRKRLGPDPIAFG